MANRSVSAARTLFHVRAVVGRLTPTSAVMDLDEDRRADGDEQRQHAPSLE